jgi:hypothetical protein
MSPSIPDLATASHLDVSMSLSGEMARMCIARALAYL